MPTNVTKLTRADLEIVPLTPDRWPDLEALFGERGAVGGCWCMWWRVQKREYDQLGAAGRRETFRSIVAADERPGLLAYHAGQPMGWCALAPRPEYPRLLRSRLLKGVNGDDIWSIGCFFVAKGYRRRGVTVALLEAAADEARARGAAVLEGYPADARATDQPDPFVWTGLLPAFRAAGFVELGPASASRRVVRRVLTGTDDAASTA